MIRTNICWHSRWYKIADFKLDIQNIIFYWQGEYLEPSRNQLQNQENRTASHRKTGKLWSWDVFSWNHSDEISIGGSKNSLTKHISKSHLLTLARVLLLESSRLSRREAAESTALIAISLSLGVRDHLKFISSSEELLTSCYNSKFRFLVFKI